MKKLSLLLCTFVLLGCSDPYGASVKAGADIAAGIGQAYSTIDTLRQMGQVSAGEELSIAGYLKFANDSDKTFLICAQAAHTSGTIGGFTACATTFANGLNLPAETALIHVNNPTAQANVNAVINGIVLGVNTLKTALGGN